MKWYITDGKGYKRPYVAETARAGRQPAIDHPALTMAGYSFSYIEGGDYSIERR